MHQEAVMLKEPLRINGTYFSIRVIYAAAPLFLSLLVVKAKILGWGGGGQKTKRNVKIKGCYRSSQYHRVSLPNHT